MEIKPQSLNCNHPGHTYSKYTTIYLTPNDELLQQAISEGTSLSKKYHPSAPNGRIRNPIERNIKSIYGMLAELSIRLLLQNEIIKRKISAKILPSTMTLVNNTFDNQIDIPLEIEGKHYDIEVRSSFPYAELKSVITYHFDILGPYTTNYKIKEKEKDYYLRVLFFNEKYATSKLDSGPEIHFVGGASKDMILKESFTNNLKQGNAKFHTIKPICKALDSEQIMNLIFSHGKTYE